MTPAAAAPVVIIGGGPTGIAAATLLSQHGVASVVLERWAEIYPQPRAVAADDEVFRILARLGIAAAFTELSRPGLGLRLVDDRLRTLSQFDRDPNKGRNGFPQSNMFDQPVLEKVLRANLQAHPDVCFTVNAEVTAIARLPGGRVRVHFTDRGTGQDHTIDAEFVLGCDGANSLVRRAIGATMTNLGFRQRWLVIDIDTDAPLGHWDGVHQVCSSVRAGTYMRVGATRYRWEFQLLPEESGDAFTTLADVAPLIAPWLDEGDFDRLRLIRTCEYTFRAQVADRWRRGNVFLLGDAAHLTPPFIGQGMGAGLRDAMNLAWKLAGVRRGVLPESALHSYQIERKSHARSMIRLAVGMGWAMSAGGRAGDLVRRHVLSRLQSVTAALGAATPPLRRSALVRRSHRRGELAGRLCPNPLIDGQRFDDLVGTGVAVVTTHHLHDRQRELLTAAGVFVLEVAAGSELGAWLGGGRACAVVVRPDRSVLAAAHDVGAVDEMCSLAGSIA